MTENEKKKLTPEEGRAEERKKWGQMCADIMAVARAAQCPPEVVATVVLMSGLNAQIHYEGETLRLVLSSLFGQKIRVPNPSNLRLN